MFAAMRNEVVRLPSWLSHYRQLGVHRFFIVDNDSSDGTREALLQEPDVHVFLAKSSFAEADFGRLWFSELMEDFGTDRWCVVADADELLAPPYWEEITLPAVAGALESEKAEALPCLLLDMYSASPIRDTVLTLGSDPLEICPFFDPDFEPREGFFLAGGERHSIPTVTGSTRRRVFGIKPYLSKVGLFRFRPGMILTSGQHGILGARLSEARGVMFHFKFLSGFVEKVLQELKRNERKTHTHEWVAYAETLVKQPDLSLFGHGSIRYRDTDQLLELGLMKTNPHYEAALSRKRT